MGEFDEMLVYRRRLRRPLEDYTRHVRAACIADEFSQRQGRPLQYENGGWIRYVMAAAGAGPLETQRSVIDYEYYLSHQLQPVAGAIRPFLRDDFSTLVGRQRPLF